MAQNDIYGKFYSPKRLKSTGRALLISMGYRSIGKTTGWGIEFLSEFIASKGVKQVLYIRRTKKELEGSAPTAFSNALRIYNKFYNKHYVMKYEKNTYYIKGEKFDDYVVFGYAFDLNGEDTLKSIPFDNLYWGMYDEFLPRRGTKYLGSKDTPYVEWDCINSLFQTIDREIGKAYANRFRLVCIGNNLTYYNPIIMKLGADKYLKTDTRMLNPKGDVYAIEQTQPGDIEATDDMMESNAYKLASHDDKSVRYAFGCGLDDDAFIGTPCGKVTPYCNVLYRGHRMGVGYDENYMFYVSNRGNTSDVVLALTLEDHGYNRVLAQQANSRVEMKMLRDAYVDGEIIFENGKCRYDINQFFMFDNA